MESLLPELLKKMCIRDRIAQCAQKMNKGNKPYLDVSFADAEGTMGLKVWDCLLYTSAGVVGIGSPRVGTLGEGFCQFKYVARVCSICI